MRHLPLSAYSDHENCALSLMIWQEYVLLYTSIRNTINFFLLKVIKFQNYWRLRQALATPLLYKWFLITFNLTCSICILTILKPISQNPSEQFVKVWRVKMKIDQNSTFDPKMAWLLVCFRVWHQETFFIVWWEGEYSI